MGPRRSGMHRRFVGVSYRTSKKGLAWKNSNFKLVEGNLLRNIDLKDNGMNYSTEITTKLILKKSKISNVNI